jgi:hypothetical protein
MTESLSTNDWNLPTMRSVMGAGSLYPHSTGNHHYSSTVLHAITAVTHWTQNDVPLYKSAISKWNSQKNGKVISEAFIKSLARRR